MAEEYPAPAHLSERSQALWREVVPARGKSPGRLALLAEGLAALDRAEEARAAIAETGLTTKTERSGVIHISPLVKIEREARQQFRQVWSDLGLHFDPRLDGRFAQ